MRDKTKVVKIQSITEEISLSINSASTRNKTDALNIQSIPPSNMGIQYKDLWDHNTSTIIIPKQFQNPFGGSTAEKKKLTSLEILQNVLHGKQYQKELYQEIDDYMAGNTSNVPKCLLPDLQTTRTLVDEVIHERERRKREGNQQQQQLPKSLSDRLVLHTKILNVGFPKVGSTTLFHYFKCIGLSSSHQQNGYKMWEKAMNNQTILYQKHDAYMQMDWNGGKGFYPQITMLDEIHEENPNATFMMNFRPIKDWIRSIKNWGDLKRRMDFFQVPGLMMTQEHLKQINLFRSSYNETTPKKKKNMLKKAVPKLSPNELARWWCGHINHIREYVQEYPSHKLIELDLYDINGTSDTLYDLFQADMHNDDNLKPSTSCWGHANTNSRNGS